MKIINLHIVSNKTYINLHNHAHNGYKKIAFKPFQTFKAQKTAETINISFFLIIPLKNIEFNSKITVFVSKIYFYRSFFKSKHQGFHALIIL